MAISPDAQFIVYGELGSLEIFDPRTGESLGHPLPETTFVTALAFSNDGNTLALGFEDGTAEVWELKNPESPPEPLRVQVGAHEVDSIAISSDQETLIVGDGQSFYSLNPKPREPNAQSRRKRILEKGERVTRSNAVFSPDEMLVLLNADSIGRLLDPLANRWLSGNFGAFNSLAFSTVDNATFATDKYIYRNGRAFCGFLQGRATDQELPNRVRFSRDGDTMFVQYADDRALWLKDAKTGSEIGQPLVCDRGISGFWSSGDSATMLTHCDGEHVLRLWDRQTGSERESTIKHIASGDLIKFSPNREFVVTLVEENGAQVWLTSTGQKVGDVIKHHDEIVGVEVVNDNTVLTHGVAVSSNLAHSKLVDLATGAAIAAPPVSRSDVADFQYSPDGEFLVCSTGKTVEVLESATGKLLTKWNHDKTVSHVAVSEDGEGGAAVVAYLENNVTTVWDVETGKKTVSHETPHEGKVTSIRFSARTDTLVTYMSDKREAVIWDIADGAVRGDPGTPVVHDGFDHGYVYELELTADGKTLFTYQKPDTMKLWDTQTGDQIGDLMSHGDRIYAIDMDPAGQTILSSSIGCARIWNVKSTKEQEGSPLENSANAGVHMSRDGSAAIITPDSGQRWIWDIKASKRLACPIGGRPRFRFFAYSGEEARMVTEHDHRVCLWEFSWDGDGNPTRLTPKWQWPFKESVVCPTGRTIILYANCDVRLWDATTGRQRGDPIVRGDGKPVSISADGSRLLTRYGNSVYLWNAATGRPVAGAAAIVSHGQAVFTRDGKRVIARQFEQQTREGIRTLWNAATATPIGRPLKAKSHVWTVSPDGHVLAAEYEGIVHFWNTETGKRLRELPKDVDGFRFSPDSKTLATSTGNTVRLWNVDNGELRGRPLFHSGELRGFRFSPDSRTILTTFPEREDTMVQLWDVGTGDARGTPLPHDPGDTKQLPFFDPRTRYVVTGHQRGEVAWRIPDSPEDDKQRLKDLVEYRTGLARDWDHPSGYRNLSEEERSNLGQKIHSN